MFYARLVPLLLAGVLMGTESFAQNSAAPSGAGVDQLCRECGVVYEIRQLSSESAFARTLEEQASPAGATINFSFGKKSESGPQLGIYGTRNMSTKVEQRSYEVIVRYDDGRFTRRELQDIADLYIGAKVRVDANDVVLDDR